MKYLIPDILKARRRLDCTLFGFHDPPKVVLYIIHNINKALQLVLVSGDPGSIIEILTVNAMSDEDEY